MINNIFLSSSHTSIGNIFINAISLLFVNKEQKGIKINLCKQREQIKYETQDQARTLLRVDFATVNFAIFIITESNGDLDLEYVAHEIYGINSFIKSSNIFILLPFNCQTPDYINKFVKLYYKKEKILLGSSIYENIIDQWAMLIMSYPASEILVHIKKENKWYLENLLIKQYFKSNKRFRVALSFCGEYRENIVYPIVNGLLRFFKKEEILYDKYLTEELAIIDLKDYLSELYTDQSDIIVLFGCKEYSKKNWPQIEWEAIEKIFLNNIKENRKRVLIFSIDGNLPNGLFPKSDGYIPLTETGEDIGNAIKFIVERYVKYIRGDYKC